MRTADNKDIAIVIPARNEAERIGACLTALTGQHTERTRIILVVNNTTDTTADVALSVALGQGLDLDVVECVLAGDQGVGLARRIGFDLAMRTMPRLDYLLTTDADCIVASDWVRRTVTHLQTVDTVCGRIGLITAETGVLDRMDRTHIDNEQAYRRLVQQVYAEHSANAADLHTTHGDAGGASLAFRKSVYVAVGGFEPVSCGEDRRIVRALRRAGYHVAHADDVSVSASCRLAGRAKGGMADTLALRVNSFEFFIDDALAKSEWLIARATQGTLGMWPPQVADEIRVHVRDVPRNIRELEVFLTSGRLVAAPARSVTELPLSSGTSGASAKRESMGPPTDLPAQPCPALKADASAQTSISSRGHPGRLKEYDMTTLKDLYIEEVQDLWSANDQMADVVAAMADKAVDKTLADRLSSAKDGIDKHTRLLKSLLEDAGAEVKKDHCKGMEGLVKEAHKHALDSDMEGAALDVAIIAQYQRLCHYGIAGFGTTKAFAEALGMTEAAGKIDAALDRIYESDDFMTELAERSRNLDAAA